MKLKYMTLIGVAFVIMFVSGCGSSSTSGSGDGTTDTETAAQKMTDSWAGYEEIINSSGVAACIALTSTSCNCPGGGTLSTGDRTLTMTACKTAAGLTYEMSGSNVGSVSSVRLTGTGTTFGKCTSATLTTVPITSCGGSVVATCAGESTNCYPTTSSSGTTSVDKTLDCTCSSSSSETGGGGDSGSSAAKDVLLSSFTAFSLLQFNLAGGVESYSCPGGGTMSITDSGSLFNAASCTNSDGLVFTGDLANSDTAQSGTMTVFGSCTDVVLSQIPTGGTCGGTAVGVCSSETATCTFAGTTGSCTCS